MGWCEMARKMSYRTDDIIEALHKTHGMIFLAAEKIGCSGRTIQRRAEEVKAVKAVIDSYRGQLLDKAEVRLETAIMNGEPWAITLALKTIGKHRGYVDRQEVTGADGGPIQIIGFETVKPEADDEP